MSGTSVTTIPQEQHVTKFSYSLHKDRTRFQPNHGHKRRRTKRPHEKNGGIRDDSEPRTHGPHPLNNHTGEKSPNARPQRDSQMSYGYYEYCPN